MEARRRSATAAVILCLGGRPAIRREIQTSTTIYDSVDRVGGYTSTLGRAGESQMAGVTRRGFIYTSGAAAAGIAGAGLAGGALSAALGAGAPALASAKAEQHMVAYIRNGSKGEVTVMAGDREVTYHDPQLVRSLQKALG